MRHRNFIETRIAAVNRSVEQQFEIHHVIDDNRAFPAFVRVPRHNHAGLGLKPRRQRTRRLNQHVPVCRIAGDSVTVAVTASHSESDVVIRSQVFDPFESFGLFRRARFPLRITGQLVQKPQRTGEETADPPFVSAVTVHPVLEILRGFAFTGSHQFVVQPGRLPRRRFRIFFHIDSRRFAFAVCAVHRQQSRDAEQRHPFVLFHSFRSDFRFYNCSAANATVCTNVKRFFRKSKPFRWEISGKHSNNKACSANKFGERYDL